MVDNPPTDILKEVVIFSFAFLPYDLRGRCEFLRVGIIQLPISANTVAPGCMYPLGTSAYLLVVNCIDRGDIAHCVRGSSTVDRGTGMTPRNEKKEVRPIMND
jgi:hypothetical protein